MNYDYQGMGYRIAAERKKRNLTQAQFAEKLGVSAQAVSKWETGAGYPDLSLLPDIATALGITIDKLFGVDVVPEKDLNAQRDPKLPETLGGMNWVATYGDRVLYAAGPAAEIDLPHVAFADGSTADLSSNYIVNKGQRIMIFDRSELTEVAEEEPEGSDAVAGTFVPGPKASGRETMSEGFRRLALDLNYGELDVSVIHDPGRDFGWFFEGDPERIGPLEAQTEAYREGDLLAIRLHAKENRFGLTRIFSFGFRDKVRMIINCPEPELAELYAETKGTETLHCNIPVLGGKITADGAGDLHFKELQNTVLTGKGAADITIAAGDDLTFDLAGASDVQILEYTGGTLTARVSGAGDLLLGGVCEHFKAQLYGACDIDARNLTAETLDATIVGPADLRIGRVIGESTEHVQFPGTLEILNRGRG